MAFGAGFRRRWERNAGLRIDHSLLSPDLKQTLPAAGFDTWVRGKLMPRDHALVGVELVLSSARTTSAKRKTPRCDQAALVRPRRLSTTLTKPSMSSSRSRC